MSRKVRRTVGFWTLVIGFGAFIYAGYLIPPLLEWRALVFSFTLWFVLSAMNKMLMVVDERRIPMHLFALMDWGFLMLNLAGSRPEVPPASYALFRLILITWPVIDLTDLVTDTPRAIRAFIGNKNP